MAECMEFPKTAEGFIEQYKFTDTKQEYTNGAELISVFRVKQMMEHYFANDNNVAYKLKATEPLTNCQQWIPVTERLPENDGSYIVTACDEGCPYGEGIWYDTVVVVAEYCSGSWSWNENGTEYDLCGIVTHWMPLPEPPRGE